MNRVPPQRPGNGHPPEEQVVETRVVPSRADIPVPPESFGRGEPSRPEKKTDDQQKNQEQDKDKNGEEEKPPLYKRPWFWAIVGVIVIVIAVVGVLWYLHAKGKLSTDDAFIEAHITNVAPRVAGHVTEVLVTDNQQVKVGQVLVRLDPVDLQQALESANSQLASAKNQVIQAQKQVGVSEAQVAQAKADVTAAQANATQADEDLKRYQSADRRAVSQQQLDAALAAARATHANLESAQQKQTAAEAQVTLSQAQVATAGDQVTRAQVAVDQAKTQLQYTVVHADQDGRIANLNVSVGDWVQAGGQALMAIVPRDVYVIANYKETELKEIHPGQRVTIRVDAYGATLDGKVDSIQSGSGAAFSLLPPENATGNYVKIVQRVPVKIVFDQSALNDSRYLLGPGMSVVPTIYIHEQDQQQ